MKKQLYIAYGSNLDKSQMAFRCPGAKPVATSVLKDYRLVFQGNPYGAHANVIPEKGQEVPVAIWEISRKNEAALDLYEGVAGGYYTKEYMEVEIDGKPTEALIYIMTPHGHGVPDDSYLATIVRGYRDFDFSAKTLNDAVRYSAERTNPRRRMAQ